MGMDMLITLFYWILLAFLLISAFLILYPMINGAVFFPAKLRAIEAMLALANAKPGDTFVDLGCGDGRVLIAFAKKGVISHGYEVNPLLVLMSKYKVKKAGVQGLAFVQWENMWKVDLGGFDIISIYGFPHIMPRFARKLSDEAKVGSRILSNVYKLPNWKEEKSIGGVRLYVK